MPESDSLQEDPRVAVLSRPPSEPVGGSSSARNVVKEPNVDVRTWGNNAVAGAVRKPSKLEWTEAFW